MSEDRQILGSRLRQAREYLELSQEDVARALTLPRSAISLIESGQRRIDAIELTQLAQLYQRPVSFFTGETVVGHALPPAVEHLARAAANLTEKDHEELIRFAEFLQSRGRS
ncbi:MAG: family transcriptional regulator [Caulobacteraceae bacterium]|nr:family transcriptional regulator [Caulobacteraceae bacterium]